eukprot:m.9860 g.9860  ORF g.9860 m.9860 type:complete len:129 (-) comp4149_c0_seq1:278-664(-)
MRRFRSSVGGRIEIPEELPSPIKYARGETPNPIVRWSHKGCTKNKLFMTEDATSHCTGCEREWNIVESLWQYTHLDGKTTEYLKADEQNIASIVGIAALAGLEKNNTDAQRVLNGILKKVINTLSSES